MDTAEKIALSLAIQNRSRQDLAESVDKTISAINKMANGGTGFSTDLYSAVESSLGVPIWSKVPGLDPLGAEGNQ